MKTQPKIVIKLSKLDYLIEILGCVALVCLWAFVLLNYNKLPEIIPVHFNENGIGDKFGNKNNILALPIVATLLFVFLTFLSKYPNTFYLKENISVEELTIQNKESARLMRIMKLILVLVFGFIVFQTIQITKNKIVGLGNWSLAITLTLIFLPIIFYEIKDYVRRKNRKKLLL